MPEDSQNTADPSAVQATPDTTMEQRIIALEGVIAAWEPKVQQLARVIDGAAGQGHTLHSLMTGLAKQLFGIAI